MWTFEKTVRFMRKRATLGNLGPSVEPSELAESSSPDSFWASWSSKSSAEPPLETASSSFASSPWPGMVASASRMAC